MARATRKPTATAAAAHPATEPTVADLCHEWRLVNAKSEYESAALPDTLEGDEEGNKIVCKAADRISEIEDALAASAPETFDDVQHIHAVVLKNMAQQSLGEEDRDHDMLAAVNWGINQLRNKAGGEALRAVPAKQEPARDASMKRAFDETAVRDLESHLWDLGNMAGLASDQHAEIFGNIARDNTYVITREEIDHLLFAVTHIGSMLQDFRSRYFAAIGLGGVDAA